MAGDDCHFSRLGQSAAGTVALMPYHLRTLLIALALGPVALAAAWWAFAWEDAVPLIGVIAFFVIAV